jgi:hypothetical protein
MSAPLIIGIHGLANKPPEPELSQWWQDAIKEGLAKNEKVIDPEFDFEMVYWADQLYKNPLHNDIDFSFDQLYNDEPYVEAEKGTLKSKRDGFLAALAARSFDLTGATLDRLKAQFGFDALADAFLGKLLRDLNLYYQNQKKQASLRDTLKQRLLANEGRKIMLVAHSMGTIIAYDVMTLLGQSNPDYKIDHFVTIGSPLGLPHVKGKIIEEFIHRGPESDRVRTPSVVKERWVNFADRKDPVALDVHIADDYGKNGSDILCEDDLVNNDYRIKKTGKNEPDRNHHKSYGYLRTPEFSKLMVKFL